MDGMTPGLSTNPSTHPNGEKKIDPRSGDDIIEAHIDAKTTGHEEVICTFLKLMVMRLHWIIQRLGL